MVGLVSACSQAPEQADPPSIPTQSTTKTTPADTSTTSTSISDVAEAVLVVGDWGSGTGDQTAVSSAMAKFASRTPIDAILTTGDNFYSDDATSLMDPYQWVEDADVPWWITWGNHDVESETRIDVVNNTFGSPPRWAIYQWGGVDVLILDSNQVTNLGQAAFFLSSMANSDRPTIISLHHPPYSCSHHGSTTEIVNFWVDILDDDVVLVLSGHDHSYQRFEKDGVAYIVSGGGGRAIRPLTDCPAGHPERIAGAELHHFLTLEQTSETIELTSIDVNGNEIDQVSIRLP